MFSWIAYVLFACGPLTGSWTGPNGDVEVWQHGDRIEIIKEGWSVYGNVLPNGRIVIRADYLADDGPIYHVGSYVVEGGKLVGDFTAGGHERFNTDGTLTDPLDSTPDVWTRRQ